MKKFLGKKSVMLTFIILAVVFLAVEIGILVRPVSYGLNYTQKIVREGVTITYKTNIKSDSVARMTMIREQEGKDDQKQVHEMWIYRDGDRIAQIGPKELISSTSMSEAQIEEANEDCMTKAQYKVKVEELEKLKKENKDAYELALKAYDVMEFGIFQAGEGENVAKCPQAIAFVVIHGVVTLALMTFAGMAVFYAIKKKK